MKRIIAFTILTIWCTAWMMMRGQTMTAMRDSAEGGYNFWLYEPSTQTEELKPLIIFLHGASLRGTDLNRVLKYGPLNATMRGIEINAYVVAPQTSSSWNADKVWKDVEWVTSHYPIDKNRISVVGMSLGGFGTFELSTNYSDRLAAGMMLCGGNTNTNYCNLTKMPFWIMHGTADKAVPVSRSNSIVNEMKACGDTSRLLYTKLQGANHGFPARIFYLTEAYEWLTSHSLNDENRAVNRNIAIPQSMISGAYGRLSGKSAEIKMINQPKKASQPTQTDELPVELQSDNAEEGSSPACHIVEEGNTLQDIAQKYHTTVGRICALNNIKEDETLTPGQRIYLRYTTENATDTTYNGVKKASEEMTTPSKTSEKTTPEVKSQSNPAYHMVRLGETLSSIARKYHTTVQKLCELNNIKNPDVLREGQKLKLPQ